MRELTPAGRRRVVILVTKEAHCLGDLLMKANYGGLDVEIAAVIGNHETLRTLSSALIFRLSWSATKGIPAKSMTNLMAQAIESA
ncbi:Formyltetrahydrofolate deformylase [Leclercia adecarboxylata]|uniref:Formyltetrahydrofolate deformylase n=1 Tax=Leclercia adecarboxylata TaxID=83655 RepID=A0A4V6JIQ9_9ENTR|nr:Formyltetrahydrofolate deformylase [Leclercia adecarboxylata]